MATAYLYKARDRGGSVREGTMEGESDTSVASRLLEQDLIPLEIKVAPNMSLKKDIHILPERIKLKDLAVFSRQFSTMISAGLSLLRALSILSDQTENKKLAETTTQVRLDVESGLSLSEAMAKHPKAFNKLFVSLIRAGETGGQLEVVLLRIADSFEKDYKLRQKIKSAMTYPVVVFGLAIVLVSVMLIFIVPVFADMFEDLGGELPLPTKILVVISERAPIVFPLVLFTAVALVAGYKWGRRRNEEFAYRTDKLKLKLPVFGDLFSKIALSRFVRTLALLLRSGVPVLQALDITSETAGNRMVGRAALDVRESVREGQTMAGPLRRHAVFPSMVVQMIAVGEDTGEVDEMLDRVGDFYEQEVESTTESLTSLLEPVMIAILGGLIGGMVISLYMPMFKVFDLIQ